MYCLVTHAWIRCKKRDGLLTKIKYQRWLRRSWGLLAYLPTKPMVPGYTAQGKRKPS